MKIQLVKSDKGSWYSNMTLPVEFEVKQEGMFNYLITEGDFKGEYLFINHCINNEKYEIKVEDKRVFDTGAKRDSDLNKPYTHNLQGYTRLRFGYLTRMGAINYGDENFLKGFPKKESLKSLDRHMSKYMNGDKSEDHLSAMIFNIQLIMLEEQKEGIKEDHYFKKST